MSQPPPNRRKAPALKLQESFPDAPAPEDRGFYSEESTMITSLERMRDGERSSKPAQEPSKEPSKERAPRFSPPSFQAPPLSAPPSGTPAHEPTNTPSQQAAPPSFTPPPFAGAPLASPPSISAPPPMSASPFMSGSSDLGEPNVSEEELGEPIELQTYEGAYELEPQAPPPYQAEQAQRPAPAYQGEQAPYQAEAQSPAPSGGAVMIAFFNPRGGVGNTSLVVNLGGALQRMGLRVALVDMDLQLAALPSSLEVKLERSLAELVMEAYQSEGPLRSALDQHHSGLTLIAQEERISEISMVTPDRLPRFFEALRESFDVVLVDGLRNFSDLAVSVMDEADVVTVSLTQDIPAVRSARKALKLFSRLGYSGGKTRVVLNRFHKRAMIGDAVIEEHLGVLITERIPNDFPFVSRGLSEGELLHTFNPKHPVCLAVDRLAAQLIGYQAPVQRVGLLSKLSAAIKRS